VRFNHPLGDCQAQATSSDCSGARFIHTVKPLKDVGQLVFRYPNPRVGNFEEGIAIFVL
jgi:hypothetical protein